MLSQKAKRARRKMVENCNGNYGELMAIIEEQTLCMRDALIAHRQTDILRDFKSNIAFAHDYELYMYTVELASKEIQRSARSSQKRNAKYYIDYIMKYKKA